MRRLDIIGVVVIVLLMMALCAYAATNEARKDAKEQPAAPPPAKQEVKAPDGPTMIDLLTAKRDALVERMQKLEAQYQLTQRELGDVHQKLMAEESKKVGASAAATKK